MSTGDSLAAEEGAAGANPLGKEGSPSLHACSSLVVDAGTGESFRVGFTERITDVIVFCVINRDDCRFPHVLPEPGTQPAFRYPPNGHNHNNNNGGRYGHRSRPSMGHHDGPPPAHIPPGTKLPFAPNGHVPHTGPSPNQPNGSPNQQQQRVPNADDFPVLRSAASAPGTPNGVERASASNGSGGLTAAQVLQAPPPTKKGKAESDTVGELADVLSKVSLNDKIS